MNKLTYIEARDKIWNAYFKDEIKPLDSKFCFCGTLCGNTRNWYKHFPKNTNNPYNGYSGAELYILENALMASGAKCGGFLNIYSPSYEDALLSGMLAALEVLKNIHRERGELIPEDEPLLTKRKLIEEDI